MKRCPHPYSQTAQRNSRWPRWWKAMFVFHSYPVDGRRRAASLGTTQRFAFGGRCALRIHTVCKGNAVRTSALHVRCVLVDGSRRGSTVSRRFCCWWSSSCTSRCHSELSWRVSVGCRRQLGPRWCHACCVRLDGSLTGKGKMTISKLYCALHKVLVRASRVPKQSKKLVKEAPPKDYGHFAPNQHVRA